MSQKLFCSYYQAYVKPQTGWFVVAILKSFDHLCFDRTINVENSIFEFFVPEELEQYFVEVMQWMEAEGYTARLQKMENRLKTEDFV